LLLLDTDTVVELIPVTDTVGASSYRLLLQFDVTSPSPLPLVMTTTWRS
jgi:hypothetical protein